MKPNGHGHVTPNADGSRTRCGGPTICKVCMAELAQLQAESAPAEVAQGEVEIPDIAATFDGLYLVPIMSLKRGDHLMTVAQHSRIVAAMAPPSPDAELVALLRELSNHPFIGPKYRKRIDAKLAEVKGVRNDDVPKPD